jgi:hypothetical protein
VVLLLQVDLVGGVGIEIVGMSLCYTRRWNHLGQGSAIVVVRYIQSLCFIPWMSHMRMGTCSWWAKVGVVNSTGCDRGCC